jgi:hypothetical protein
MVLRPDRARPIRIASAVELVILTITCSVRGGDRLAVTRTHRGPHPEDGLLFGPAALPALCEAMADFCWLLDRGYASTSPSFSQRSIFLRP